MDVREDLYGRICEALGEIEDVKHIDMWNRNVEFIDEETAWERPAVFIEICPVRWRSLATRVEYRSEPRVLLHIVTDWAEGEDGHPGIGRMTDLPERIHHRLAGLEGETFYELDLVESITNHDHGEILEMIEAYECFASRIFEEKE